jgi:predicted ribosome quality control (RQC) complex YloA/Tae2 family protein
LTTFSIFSATGGEAASYKIAEQFYLDSKFLRFWGNFLLQAAEGQKRFEDLTRWMTAGLSGSDDLTEMFKEAYGLKRKPGSDATPSETWEKAAEQFRQAFADYLDLFDAVPRTRHEALRKERERLAKKVEEQANTISKLRAQLAESRMAEGRVLSGFQQLMDIQNEQFRQVSERMAQMFPGKK